MRWQHSLSCLLVLVSTEAMAGHPVRVARDGNGVPHFFEAWNGSAYEPIVLRGAASFDFGGPNDVGPHYAPLFQGLRDQGMNFVRMWMRPSDGMFSSEYRVADGGTPINKVVLDLQNPDFTDRLRDVLDAARRNANGVIDNGLIVEVMLWDTSTQWHEANLAAPTSWATCFTDPNPANCPNIHHPNNHIKSLSDPVEVGGLSYGSVGKLEGGDAGFWFNTADDGGNADWRDAQRDYMTQIMNVVSQFDNVTVEVINEGGRQAGDPSVEWRKQTHEWLALNWPGFLYQSQSYGAPNNENNRIASDDAIRLWGQGRS